MSYEKSEQNLKIPLFKKGKKEEKNLAQKNSKNDKERVLEFENLKRRKRMLQIKKSASTVLQVSIPLLDSRHNNKLNRLISAH